MIKTLFKDAHEINVAECALKLQEVLRHDDWQMRPNLAPSHESRDNLDNREGHPYITPVDKYYVTWITKGVRCYLKFQL